MSREKKLVDLWKQLRAKAYQPGRYMEFFVYEPKARLVHAPHIQDKIVPFSTHLVLQELYRTVFIKDSYACLDGKGPHKAVERIQQFMRAAQRQHPEPYILKPDIRKFFYSIDRELLKRIYRKKIPPEETDFLWLLDRIVDSSPEGETGVPLGTVTSRNFANICLNELDQSCKRYLGIKWYVRYMDDVTMLFPSKADAKEALDKVTAYVRDRLHLETNEKTQIYPVRQGINTLGFQIHTTHRKVRRGSKKSMKRRIRAMDRKRQAGDMTEKEVQQAVSSWLGHARHSNSYNLCKKIFAPYPYIKMEDETWKFGERSPKEKHKQKKKAEQKGTR